MRAGWIERRALREGYADSLNENNTVFEGFGVKVIVPGSGLEGVSGIIYIHLAERYPLSMTKKPRLKKTIEAS
jgi:hypothetical protein